MELVVVDRQDVERLIKCICSILANQGYCEGKLNPITCFDCPVYTLHQLITQRLTTTTTTSNKLTDAILKILRENKGRFVTTKTVFKKLQEQGYKVSLHSVYHALRSLWFRGVVESQKISGVRLWRLKS